jgi:4-oxalmesaconate hydratase
MNLGELNDRVMKNVYFDTCVYHQPGIDLLLKVIPSDNVLFASETIGAVRAINPETGIGFDNTHEYIKATQVVNDVEKQKIYSTNAMGVYKRLGSHPAVKGR